MADSAKLEAAEARALNDLIASCRDAEEGYAKAAKGVHDRELSDKLTAISGERGKFAEELGTLVSGLGFQPSADAHYGGILHRGWVDLETRIRPKTEHDIIQDCVNGDTGTLKHYEHALGIEVAPELRSVVGRQRASVAGDLATLQERLHKGKAQSA